jgi:bifunctional non-homologous end joining protein LigD
MGLKEYKQKRNFRKTREPEGKKEAEKKKKSSSRIFVVQQHWATRLHYDFRLEVAGVLKSWAVPKGPSLNPNDKRLAMMVEDHPFDYKDFEGTIPEGNYGAGNVIVWDNGTYYGIDRKGNVVDDQGMLTGIEKGHITIILDGKKLKGEFALVKLHGAEKNAWLLIKARKDKYATEKDVLLKNKSVISGKKIKERVRSGKSSVRRRRIAPEPGEEPEAEATKGRKILKGELIRPMAAELADEPFDDKDWIFELKYDGYRALALLDGKGNVQLYSRNLLSFNSAYSDIVDELKKIDHPALIDGEVVIEDEKGHSHFQLLQNYKTTGEGPLKYYVFDLLSLNGEDTMQLTVLQRKELLRELLSNYSFHNIFYADHIEEKGKAFFSAAVKNKLEGIIAKNANSTYLPGRRSSNWLKIKITRQQEAVIVGITEPRGGRTLFGSLLLGAYKNGTLEYIGHCGTGFNEAALKELYHKFKPYFVSQSPFSFKVDVNAKAQWLKPKFVCEVKFSEWTADGSMRHPVFLGLREDKSPKEVHREIAGASSENSKPDMDEKNSQDNYELKIGKVTLKLTNQNKIYFPGEGITKGDLVNYYSEISSVILPYLKDRPQSMNRFPNGIQQQSFYQKDVDKKSTPRWVQTEKVYSESNEKNINYLICNDKATLVYMANLGCIEINPWNSRITHLLNPDWVVIDLDPEKISFKEVVRAALEVKKVLDELEIECYCKTSGATGLHIYIPMGAKYDYDTVKQFAELIAQITQKRLPETTSIVRLPSKRQGKVYLDFLQNRKGQTLAAPYSVRPKPGATVSTPLEWKEVNEKLDPTDFTIKTTLKRLDKKGDMWKPVLGKGVNLMKVLKTLQEE